jgi:hypothetical protein
MVQVLAQVKKAITGGVASAGVLYASVQADGITYAEGGALVGAFLVGFVLVYFTPKNADPVK